MREKGDLAQKIRDWNREIRERDKILHKQSEGNIENIEK